MSTPIRRALYGRLAGDTTLNNLLGAPPSGYSKSIYFQQAPATAAFPFVVFQKTSGVPTETFTVPAFMNGDLWLVKAVARDTTADRAESIADRFITLLNDASLSISGASLLYLRRQSDVEYPEVSDGVLFHHCGAYFRLVTG
jgi:hypothetical protein